jgi:antirestriction protein
MEHDDHDLGAEHADQQETDHPKIWVGSLSDYNNGRLHGEWLDAARSADEIYQDIHRMLAASPTAAKYGDAAEEWGIFDHEGFGPARISEFESISTVSRIARGIAEHGLAFAAWVALGDLDDRMDRFADAYLGKFASMEAYAEQLIDDLGYNQLLDETVPEHIRPYVAVNVAGLAQDMRLSGEIAAVPADENGIYLFDGRI